MISPSACPVSNSSSASHVKANCRNDCESANVRLFAHSSVKLRDWNAENVCSESRRSERGGAVSARVTVATEPRSCVYPT